MNIVNYVWADDDIEAGGNRKKIILDKLRKAKIILLLTSSNFFSSDFDYEVEMEEALKMQREDKARVLPVIIRPCLWRGSRIASLTVLPRNGNPVKNNIFISEEALRDVAEEIAKAAKKLKAQEKPKSNKRYRNITVGVFSLILLIFLGFIVK